MPFWGSNANMKSLTTSALALHCVALAAAQSLLNPRNIPLSPRQSNQGITEFASVSLLDTPCEIEFSPSKPDIAWVELVAASTILRVNITSGEQTRFPLSNPIGIPSGMEFLPDGYLWFSEVAGNAMVRLDPRDGSMTEFPFPWTNISAVDDLPVGVRVTIDVSGNKDRGAWFTAVGLNAIGRIDIDTFEYSLYPLPHALSAPLIIQPGPGNTMVFSEGVGNKVSTIDVHTKEIKEYDIPTPLSLPQGVTTAPNGLIWWVGTLGGNFGTIDTTSGLVTEFFLADIRAAGNASVVHPNGGRGISLGTSSLLNQPGTVRVGSDGKVYMLMGNWGLLGNRVAQWDPETQQLIEFETPASLSGPCDLNSQQDGRMFFAEFGMGKLGRLDY